MISTYFYEGWQVGSQRLSQFIIAIRQPHSRSWPRDWGIAIPKWLNFSLGAGVWKIQVFSCWCLNLLVKIGKSQTMENHRAINGWINYLTMAIFNSFLYVKSWTDQWIPRMNSNQTKHILRSESKLNTYCAKWKKCSNDAGFVRCDD